MNPVNIAGIHLANIACPQPQPGQQQNRGTVPQSNRGVTIARGDHTFDIVG